MSEVITITETFETLNLMLNSTDKVARCSDHKNVLFTFRIIEMTPNLEKSDVVGVLCWLYTTLILRLEIDTSQRGQRSLWHYERQLSGFRQIVRMPQSFHVLLTCEIITVLRAAVHNIRWLFQSNIFWARNGSFHLIPEKVPPRRWRLTTLIEKRFITNDLNLFKWILLKDGPTELAGRRITGAEQAMLREPLSWNCYWTMQTTILRLARFKSYPVVHRSSRNFCLALCKLVILEKFWFCIYVFKKHDSLY